MRERVCLPVSIKEWEEYDASLSRGHANMYFNEYIPERKGSKVGALAPISKNEQKPSKIC